MYVRLTRMLGVMRGSPTTRAVRLLTRTSRPLAILLAADVILHLACPLLVLVAGGQMVSHIAGAVGDGWGSPAGGRLVTSLILLGAALAAAILTAPFHDWLARTIKMRVTFAMRSRLMAAVSQPIGIAHLEDTAILDRVAMANGTLRTFFPGDAPAILARVVTRRFTWVIGCLVVGAFRWWLGLALLLVWQLARGPLLRRINEHVSASGGNAAVMRRAEYFQSLATKPPAAKELRVFGLGPWVIDRYRTHWSEGMAELWRIRDGTFATTAWVGAMLLLVYIGSCGVLAKAAYDGDVSLAHLAVLLPVLFLTMTGGRVDFDDIMLAFQLSALPELDTLETDLSRRRSELLGRAAVTAKPSRAIRFEGVSFRYPGASSDVVDALDLTIPARSSTAIVGANGAGKTTLVKLLARLHDPTSGVITVDGVPLDGLDAAAWQRKVAVLFQDFLRLPLTAAENIGLGALEHLADRDGLVECAERAGALALIESLPDGWDTCLSRQLTGGVDLSGGEWQRVTLARALFAARHGASVLVLDEPTSWLDVRREAEFFERFLDLTEGLTTIVISHRFSTVRLADQICVLDGGSAIEVGSHRDLIERDGTYARTFRLQADRFLKGSEPVG